MKEDIKIEVESDHLVLVLPRRMDTWITPYKEAEQLGVVLETAAQDIAVKDSILDAYKAARESGQIRLAVHPETRPVNVCFVFEWSDRIKLGYHAALLVASAIKLKAQDCRLFFRGVRMTYDKDGHAIPNWSHQRKSFPVS